VTNPRYSPFNIATRILLDDFDKTQVRDLVTAWCEEERHEFADRLFHWSGGHPFITQELCNKMAAQPPSEEEIDRAAAVWITEDQAFRGIRAAVRDDLALRREIECLLDGRPVTLEEGTPSDPHSRLLLLGAIKRGENRSCVIRNRLYKREFQRMRGLKDVFISYRRQSDWGLAELLEHAIKEIGLTVSRDSQLTPGQEFPVELLNKIESCHSLAVVLTPGALDRSADPQDWVRREIEHARESGVRVIPLLFNGCPPPDRTSLPERMRFLADIHAIRVDPGGVAQAAATIRAAIAPAAAP
jgi:hypothetical protein